MTGMGTCPHCGASLQGDPIPQEYIDAGYYGDSTHYGRAIGYSAHDYVQFWICPDCDGTWHRWPDGHPYQTRAAQLMQQFAQAA